MMYLLTVILVLTLILFVVNRIEGKIIVCPICAATILTWFGALVGMYFKLFQVNNIFLSILIAISLGASVEKYGKKFGLWWKVITVLLGAPAVYYLTQAKLEFSLYLLLALLFATVIFALEFTKKSSKGAYKNVFEDCCN